MLADKKILKEYFLNIQRANSELAKKNYLKIYW